MVSRGFDIGKGTPMKNRLRELRETRGLTQDEVAKAVRVTRQTINAIENDKYNPTLELAFRLSRFYGESIETVFLYKDE